MATKPFAEIKNRKPRLASPQERADAHLANLADDTGIPLAELRRLGDLTQVEMARRLAVTQPTVSETERTGAASITTVRRYVEAVGAHLEIAAVFDDGRRVLLDV